MTTKLVLLSTSIFALVSIARTLPPDVGSLPGPTEVCFGTNYDPKRFSCCNDFEICSRSMRKCCGRHCYSVGASMCCEGRIIDKCNQFNSGCCGQVCIDLAHKACRDGVIVDACAGADSAWCGETCFDKSTHLCCRGKVVARCGFDRSTAECCGHSCYNTKTESCCNDKVIHPKCVTNECCGSICCPDTR